MCDHQAPRTRPSMPARAASDLRERCRTCFELMGRACNDRHRIWGPKFGGKPQFRAPDPVSALLSPSGRNRSFIVSQVELAARAGMPGRVHGAWWSHARRSMSPVLSPDNGPVREAGGSPSAALECPNPSQIVKDSIQQLLVSFKKIIPTYIHE